MSLFKKPKRNFRLRESGDGEDAEEEKTAEIVGGLKASSKKEKKSPKKSTNTQQLLSFDLDLNEGDDGEVFQVKKSSQSKKMRKLLDKERKKKKEAANKDDKEGGDNKNGVIRKKTITTEDDIVITVKNTLPTLVLNGREAEAAAPEGISDEEDDGSTGHHRFSKASTDVKSLLQRGRIPDAATIHAARKQRQHVREMADFIPISEENSREKENGGRLLEDDEGSDAEEDRIKMTVDTASEDRLRLQAEFNAAQQPESGESDKGEDDEWEQQQIRKGVTGAQIAAVQQETMFYQQYVMGCPPPAPIISLDAPAPPTIGNAFLQPPRPTDPPTATSVLGRLKTRLGELREVEKNHIAQLDGGKTEMRLLVEETEKVGLEVPEYEEKYRFYQELRGYVTDLVDCLDEKVLVIEMLEERVLNSFSRHVQEAIGRRRQDIQDQAFELPSNPLKGSTMRDEAMVRRVAEREGRRIRRQRQREIRGINVGHIDGMSSDDEQTETQQITTNSSKEVLERDAKQVLEDVYEDFCSVDGVLSRFQAWRNKDMYTYVEAYVSLCLPKILGPLIRLSIVFWNPMSPSCVDVEKSAWFKTMLLYGLKPGEIEETLKKDPDSQLIPRIIDRIIIPRLNQLVKEGWDPMSSSQTIGLVAMVTRLVQEYPTLTINSKTVATLMSTVIAKIKTALDSDVFIPIYSKVRLLDGKVNNFFIRQCAMAVKLLGNIARWQGLLNDTVLFELAIDSLLNRYLLLAIGSTTPLQAANIVHMIGSVLPRVWLNLKLSQLSVFLNQARNVSLLLSPDKPLERDALERMSSIL